VSRSRRKLAWGMEISADPCALDPVNERRLPP
jgi:hypothetical protein